MRRIRIKARKPSGPPRDNDPDLRTPSGRPMPY
jgi:hypothetical protein